MMSNCDDISEFLEMLKQMRVIDDKIVHALNTSIPTESFSSKIDAHATCKELFYKLVESHANREKVLGNCLSLASVKLQKLKQEKAVSSNDIQVLKKLRSEQNKVRELQTEMNVEEVIRGRTLKIYNERCRMFYRPNENDAQL